MGFRSGGLERGQTRSVGLDSRRAPREPNLHRDGGTGHAPWRPGGPMGWLLRPSVARRSSPASRARPRGRRGGSGSILTDFRPIIAVCSHARRATDRRSGSKDAPRAVCSPNCWEPRPVPGWRGAALGPGGGGQHHWLKPLSTPMALGHYSVIVSNSQ